MNKKVYFQSSIFLHCILFILLIFSLVFQGYAVGGLISMIKRNTLDAKGLAILIVFELAFATTFRVFLRMGHNNIHITNEKVYIPDDWMNKKEKLQYYAEIGLKDIRKIDIVILRTNNRGGDAINCINKAFLQFENENEEKVRMYIFYYRHKTVNLIIRDIEKRCKEIGNDIKCPNPEEIKEKINYSVL